MPLLDLSARPTWAVIAIFAAAAAAVWWAGTGLARGVDAIAERRHLGKAFMGALVLGGITSLPEAATTVSAAATGNAALAVNNLFGGVAMQVVLLAMADVLVGSRALTSLVGRPEIFVQGMLLMLVLVTPAAGILVGGPAVGGVGAWTIATLLLAVAAFGLIRQVETSGAPAAAVAAGPAGPPADPPAKPSAEPGRRPAAAPDARRQRDRLSRRSTRALVAQVAGLGAVVLAAGVALALTGEQIADRTGLGSSFVGAIAVALATSLPEVSTTVAAVRLGEYRLATSNLLGTNIINLGFLLLADVAFRAGPVLDEVGTFSVVGALLGVAVTAVYVVGMVLRRPATVLRLGYDSLVAVLLYLGGVALLYTLR